jgi:peptidoglycan/xylan/chitin deacetylase (PgdA/CDA1 family)
VNIFLTYDYELFFGDHSGTVGKCMLSPTQKLMDLCKGKKVQMTFFVDVGFLISADKYPELREEVSQVKAQILQMLELGHDVQLHIHPHWEKSTWENGEWKFGTDSHYKLADFTKEEAVNIVRNYKEYLETLIGRKVIAFRAGGWCIQPFSHLEEVFKETGIRIDSTVIPGDFLERGSYSVDF